MKSTILDKLTIVRGPWQCPNVSCKCVLVWIGHASMENKLYGTCHEGNHYHIIFVKVLDLPATPIKKMYYSYFMLKVGCLRN